MFLHNLINIAPMITFNGMQASAASLDGLVFITAYGLDGLEYYAKFMPTIEVELQQDGTATLTDIDGEEASLRFFVNMGDNPSKLTDMEVKYLISCVQRDTRGLPSVGGLLNKLRGFTT